MRFNRGTVVLLVVSLVVIVAVLLLLTNQAAAPGSESLTPTGEAAGGPVFPGVTEATVVRFEVRDNTTGQRLAMTRSAGNDWGLEADQMTEGTAQDNTGEIIPTEIAPSDIDIATSGFPVDQEAAASNLSSFLSLASDDSFTSADLATFGLAQPQYSVFAVNDDGAVYVMHLGNQNPSSTRYYAVAAQIGAADTSPEAQSMRPLLEREEVDTSAGVSAPSGPAIDQNLIGANPTLDAIAEQLQTMEEGPERLELAATYSAMIEQGAIGDVDGTAEATAESTGDATSEATAEATADNDMQPDLNLPNVETSLEEATPVVESEGTAVVEEDLPDEDEQAVTAVGDETTLPEGTVEPVAINSVQLSGEQTILLVPSSTIDTLIALISAPPVIVPTATPTPFPTANPFSEVDQTATAAAQSTASAISTQLAAMAAVTVEATSETTGEATGEATESAAEATTAP